MTYTIPIITIRNNTVTNVVIIDTIPNDTSIIANSLKVNCVTVTGSTNPPGLTIGTLPANGVTTVSFQVQILTIPSPNPIPNTATVGYRYIVDPTTPIIKSISTNSNTVNTQVNNANLGNTIKLVNKSFATCNDTINYTIVIPNGTVLVANSVSVNGIQQTGANPGSGVTIPNIAPGSTATLTFSVQVLC
ncbi:hypothetical protein DVW12_16985 [Clostridium botulinum]|nr:hypothetical protein [Clostridium botulinum]